MEGQGVIYLRNWTISSIACGELECITVGVKVSSLFCYQVLNIAALYCFGHFLGDKFLTLWWKVELQQLPRLARSTLHCITVITTVVVRAESSSILHHQWPCISLARISRIFCFISHPHHLLCLLVSCPVLPRTSVSLCHFPNFSFPFHLLSLWSEVNCLSFEL